MKNPQYKLHQVGTDTEVFLVNPQTEEPVPAIGLIGGTKHQPKPVPELGDGYAVQEDNVMLEYNVPPCATKAQFVTSVMRMNSYLKKLLTPQDLAFRIAPSMMFDAKQLTHPQAMHLGCEPDFNVWTRDVNPSPKAAGAAVLETMRTAGGHIHVSFALDDVSGKALTIYDKEPLVKALDMTLGLPSLFLDGDGRRRQLYGKAGAFRAKDYGIEYRVLSNFWTRSPELIEWAYDGVLAAIRLLNMENGQEAVNSCRTRIRLAIDHGSQEDAHVLLSQFGMSNRAGLSHHAKVMPSSSFFAEGTFDVAAA